MQQQNQQNHQHNQQNYHSNRSRREYPFYRTYIDIQCRKDILTENQHMNKKIKSQITPFLPKINKKVKQNKLRILFFIGFICLFKLEPVYDYFFQNNHQINWVYNNFIDYYTDCTKPYPNTWKQLSKQKKIVSKSHQNRQLSEFYYELDKKYPFLRIGYDWQKQRFMINQQDKQLSLQEFIEISNKQFGGNVKQIKSQLSNILMNSRQDALL